MNTDQSSESPSDHALDTALRAKIRPVIADLVDEAAAQSPTSIDWSTAIRRLGDDGDASEVQVWTDNGVQSAATSHPMGGGRKALAVAAALALIFGAIVALGKGRGQSVRVADDSVPSPAVDGTTFGELFPGAAFTGEYAVIDPSTAPEFKGLRPVTYANVTRWLNERLGEIHWMVPADIATNEAPANQIRWRGPVEPPPDWLIVPNSDPAWASEGDGSTRTIQTHDGTWVEVSWLPDQPSAIDDWVAGLGSLPTATDILPPDGYVSLAQAAGDLALQYTLTDVGANAGGGAADSAEVATTVEGDDAELWLDLITIRYDHDLDDTEALNEISRFGRADPVTNFRGEGELYRLGDRGPEADVEGPPSYFWRAGPRTLVWIRAGDGLDAGQVEHYLDSLALSDAVPVELDLTYNFSNGPPDIDAEVSDVRFGDFGPYRFVYLRATQTGSDGQPETCALLAVGGPFQRAACQPLDARTASPTCVYSVDPAREVLGGEFDGYVLTLLVQADVADRVTITHGGGARTTRGAPGGSSTEGESTDSSVVTEATIAEPVIESGPEPAVADGTPVRTVDIAAHGDGLAWVAKSARVPRPVTVAGDGGLECLELSPKP